MKTPSTRSLRALDALNFFLADIQGGVGPFLVVFLTASLHWNSAAIGTAMFASGLAGVIAQLPAGALIDAVRPKRLIVAVAAGLIALACLSIALFPRHVVIIGAQSFIGIAGAVFAPAVAAISLGLVGRQQLDGRAGRNASLSSAGNIGMAVGAGLVGAYLSRDAIFYFVAAMSVFTIASVLSIREEDIDYEAARGSDTQSDDAPSDDARSKNAQPAFSTNKAQARQSSQSSAVENKDDSNSQEQVSGITALFADKRVLLFALSVIGFHFANAALLTLVTQLLSTGAKAKPSLMTSACIVAAQLVIIPLGVIVGQRAESSLRKPLYLIAFAVLPLRCFLYVVSHNSYYLVGLQTLDGLAGGIFGIMQLLVIADLTRGTGRFNITQGALGMAVGIGASLSNLLAGFIVKHSSYNAAFITMGCIASGACLLFYFLVPETKSDAATGAVEPTLSMAPA